MMKALTFETETKDVLMMRFNPESDNWELFDFSLTVFLAVLKQSCPEQLKAIETHEKFLRDHFHFKVLSRLPIRWELALKPERKSAYASMDDILQDYRRVSDSEVCNESLAAFSPIALDCDMETGLSFLQYFVRCLVTSVFYCLLCDACTSILPILKPVFNTRERDYLNLSNLHVCANILRSTASIIGRPPLFNERERSDMDLHRRSVLDLLSVLERVDEQIAIMYTDNKYDEYSVDMIVSSLSLTRLPAAVPPVRQRRPWRRHRVPVHACLRKRYPCLTQSPGKARRPTPRGGSTRPSRWTRTPSSTRST